MGIVSQSTSIAGASAAASGVTAQTAIRDALVGHPSGAWTLVEEFDAGGTIHWVVVKNSTAISGIGSDFYLCIGRVIATGVMCKMVGEVYTTATHTLGTYVPSSSGSNASNTILADGSYAAGSGGSASTFTLGTSIAPGSTGPLAPVNVAASTMRFVSIVDTDYAIVNLNGQTWYFGALTDLIVPAAGLVAATPIGLFELFSGATPNFGALTRHPIDAALAPMQVSFSHAIQPISIAMSAIQRLALDTALYSGADRFQSNRVAASEMAAIMAAANGNNAAANNNASRIGALRAKFKNLRWTTYPGAAVTYDTIAVDGNKHIILNDRGFVASTEFVSPYQSSSTIKSGFVCNLGVAAG